MAVNLQRHNIRAAAYHAGMPGRTREKVQDDFLHDRINVIVATIAFGMGVDKPNVRFVIHHDLPKSIESYYQETGRAGRDGMESEALLLYGSGDVNLVRRLIENVENIDQRRVEVHKLNSMVALAEALTCRRRVLLGYFSEEREEDCGNCDVCLDPPETYEASSLALSGLQCVREAKGDFAIGYIVDILRGSKNARILANKHERLKTHGCDKTINVDEWMAILRQLVHQGYFTQDVSRRGALTITKKGRTLLREKTPVILAKYQPGIKRKLKRFTQGRNEALFKKLLVVREQLAEQEDAAPHTLFSDVTLTEMSQMSEVTDQALLRLSGMGQHKFEAYADTFRPTLEQYVRDKAAAKNANKGQALKLMAKGPAPSDAQNHTWALYRKGQNIDAIAAALGISKKTVLTHYISLVRAACHIDVPALIDDFDIIMEELDDADPYASLSELKQELSIELTNEMFRLVLAWREAIGVN